MRITYRVIATLAATAMATGVLGLQTAEAADSGERSCAIQPRRTTTTADHYALTNIRAIYRTDAPKINAYAFYTLVGEPQDCADGEFFVIDVLTARIMSLTNGSTRAQDWRDVSFTLPSGQRFVQVMHGEADDPRNATFVGSISKLLP